MATKTNNPEPQAVTAHIPAADIMRRVVQSGQAVHKAGLALIYAATLYLLRVNHFESTNSKNYMTVTDAVEYMREELQKQTGVKNRMLANYLDPAKVMFTALSKSKNMFLSTLNDLGKATTVDDGVKIIAGWLETNKDRKIETINDLRVALGYSVRKPEPITPLTPAKAMERVENVMKALEGTPDKPGIIGVGKGKLQESALATAIVPQLKSKGSFVVEAIKQITERSELDLIERAIKDQLKTLTRLAKEAKESVAKGDKASAKLAAKVKAAGKKPSAVQRTNA